MDAPTLPPPDRPVRAPAVPSARTPSGPPPAEHAAPAFRVRTPDLFSGPASAPVSFLRFLLAARGPLLFAAFLLGVVALSALLWWLPVRPDRIDIDYAVRPTRSPGGVAASEGARPAPVQTARLSVDSDPQQATVQIGADSVGVTPLRLDRLRAGPVRVAVRTAEGVRDTVVTLRPGDDATVAFRIQRAPRRTAPPAPRPEAPRADVAAARASEPSVRQQAPRPATRDAAREAAPVVIAEARPPARPRPARAEPAGSSDASRPARAPATRSAPPARPAEPPRARAATTSLRITSSPAGAVVAVDGLAVGRTPVTVPGLAPGTHSVELVAAGHDPMEREVVLTAGQPRSIQLSLRQRTGTLEVSAPAGSEVSVDGRVRGQAGSEPLQVALAPGPHRVRVVSPNGAVTTETVFVSASVTVSVTVRPPARTPNPGAPADRDG